MDEQPKQQPFIPQQQSTFAKLKESFSRVMLRFGGSKVLGVVVILAILVALPLTVVTLQQRQTLEQRASGTAATQACGTDFWSIHHYVGPYILNGSTPNYDFHCDGEVPGAANYYCHSQQEAAFGDPPSEPFTHDFRNIMRGWGAKVASGRIKYHRLRHKDGYYAGPATGWFMRSDSPAYSNGRSMDSDSGVIMPIPPSSARADIVNLFKQGKIIVEGVCGEAAPTAAPTAVPTAAPTTAPTAAPTTAATPTPASGTIAVELQLIGIGVGQDTGSDGSIITRNAPQSTTRAVTVDIKNAANQSVSVGGSTLTYNAADGLFKGNINVPSAAGSYTVKVKIPGYLKRQIPGIVTIPLSGSTPAIPKLIAGDLNDDNSLDAADYNLFDTLYKGCNAPVPTPRPSATECAKADLNNDGQRDLTDYKIMFVGLLTRSGD